MTYGVGTLRTWWGGRRALTRHALAIALTLIAGGGVFIPSARAADSAPPGAVWAWGRGLEGQLGQGERASLTLPGATSGLTDVISVATGHDHTLAIKSDGTVLAWGKNQHGQIGDGTTGNALAPVAVVGLSGVVSVAAGQEHSLAVKSDGSVWAWGMAAGGRLGTVGSADSMVPLQLKGIAGARAVAATAYQSVALKADGTVWVWGDGTGGPPPTPFQVPGIAGATAVSGGGNHVVVLTADGGVYAWGGGGFGELGDGSLASLNKGRTAKEGAVRVSGLTGATAVSAGKGHSLAVRADGSLWAWGKNNHGQLGADSADTCNALPCSRTPIRVGAFGSVIAAAAGTDFSLALAADHSVWSWGLNNLGQLGNQATADSRTPVQVVGLSGVRAIGAGAQHTVAIATPIISIDASRLDLGEHTVGDTGASQTITIANDGSAPLNAPLLGSASISGTQPDDFSITQDTCTAATVPAGARCSISVALSPKGLGGRAGTLTLTDNTLSGPHSVALSGTGTVNVSPASLTFGEPTPGPASSPLSVGYSVGNTAVAISRIDVSTEFGVTADCPIAPATVTGTCTISVSYRPTAGGARTGTLTIVDDQAGSPRAVTLSVGASRPDVAPPAAASPSDGLSDLDEVQP